MRGATRWLVCGIAALVATVTLIRWIPDVAPDGDLAVIDTYALHVLGPGLRLGAYSRFGWNHPGPMYFQLLAPLYWLSGAHHLAILVTVAAINAASVAGIVFLLFRRNAGLACAAFVLLAVYATRMSGLLASPWNPHVAMLPFACLVVAAADTAAGRPWLLPLVVALATFVVQTHVSYAPLAVIAMLVAATTLRLPSARRPFLIAIALGVLLWTAPLLDQLSRTGTHNLSLIVQFARDSTPHDPAAAGRLFQRMALAPFIVGTSLWDPAPSTPADRQLDLVSMLQVGALLIAGVTWLVRRRSFEAILVLTLLSIGAAGFWAARRTPDTTLQAHTLLWASILGTLGWAAAAGLILEVAPRGTRRVTSAFKWAALAATLVLGVWHVAAVRAEELPRSDRSLALSRAVASYLDARQVRDVLVHIPQDWGVAAGTVLQLYRAGFITHVDADWVSMFGTSMTPSGTEGAAIQFATPDERVDDFDHRTTHQLLGDGGGYFVFAVAADPPSSAARTLDVIARSDEVDGPAERLGDGILSAGGRGPLSPAAVGFVGTTASVVVTLPAETIGIRLSGQPASVWQLHCGAGESARPAGQVRIDGGTDTATGRAFLRDLPGCQRLQIAPAAAGVLSWLTEVQILVR